MNLIFCSESCVYQTDGICELSCPAELSANPTGGCSYFKERINPSVIFSDSNTFAEESR